MVEAPEGAAPIEIIVAFAPNRKFTPRGTLEKWQRLFGPIVGDQPLLGFMIELAAAGILLELAPADVGNMVVEMKGESSCGKSTTCMFAASFSSGDPSRETCGAKSWNTTLEALEALEALMATHADNLLVLDEANNAGVDRRAGRDHLLKAAFRLSSTEGKHRLRTGVEVTGAKLLTLSNSNETLAVAAKASPEVTLALQARVPTLDVSTDRPLGVLDTVPKGSPSARAAIEELRHLVTICYGSPHRALVTWVTRRRHTDEAALRARIAADIERFNERSGAANLMGAEARASKVFALAYAAGRILRECDIVPKSWCGPYKAARRAYALWLSGLATTRPASPAKRPTPRVPRHDSAASNLSSFRREAAAGGDVQSGKGLRAGRG
jgi:hypothetical protein